jgi:hypothetical protein
MRMMCDKEVENLAIELVPDVTAEGSQVFDRTEGRANRTGEGAGASWEQKIRAWLDQVISHAEGWRGRDE